MPKGISLRPRRKPWENASRRIQPDEISVLVDTPPRTSRTPAPVTLGATRRIAPPLPSPAAGILLVPEKPPRALIVPATSIEVADRIDAFSPEVDLTLRRLLDHLIEGERKTADDGKERTYQLHPAAKLALAAEGGA